MKNIFIALISMVIALSLMGCSKTTTNDNSKDYHSGTYPSALVLNNKTYYKSIVMIKKESLDKMIGKISKQVIAAMPKHNGEANELPIGSKLYKIKGKDLEKVIAVELNNNFYEASIIEK